MKMDNYEIARERAQRQFLTYDQAEMIRRFRLESDEAYIYLTFCGRPYRVDRRTGMAEGSDDGFVTVIPGSFNDSMTIYDVLCCAKPDCFLTGEYVLTNSLPGVVHTAGSDVGDGAYRSFARFLEAHKARLHEACRRLGGVLDGKGDIAYRLPVFDFLPMRLEFWEADEEFEPELRLLWDRNVQSYMRYETLWYAAGFLLQRIREIIDGL